MSFLINYLYSFTSRVFYIVPIMSIRNAKIQFFFEINGIFAKFFLSGQFYISFFSISYISCQGRL